MKFLLFDEVRTFEPKQRVVAAFTLPSGDGDAFNEHFPRALLYPGTLVIESMVQALGWLAIASHDYRLLTVLTGIEDARAPTHLAPGTTLTLHGELVGTNRKGSVGRAWAEVDDERVGSVGRAIFGHLPHPDPAALHARFRGHGGAP